MKELWPLSIIPVVFNSKQLKKGMIGFLNKGEGK